MNLADHRDFDRQIGQGMAAAGMDIVGKVIRFSAATKESHPYKEM